MSGLHIPLHIADVEGHTVRFFRSPVYERTKEPDFPWHCIDDLWPIFIGSSDAVEFARRKLRSAWKEPKTIAVEDGLVTIAPHFMAEGMIAAIEEMEERPPNFGRLRGRYRNNCTQALKKQISHLPLEVRLTYALSAMDRF